MITIPRYKELTPAPWQNLHLLCRSTISLGRQWVIGFTWVALCLGSERVQGGTVELLGFLELSKRSRTLKTHKDWTNKNSTTRSFTGRFHDFCFDVFRLMWCPQCPFFHGKVLLNAVWKPKSPETYHESMMLMGHHPLLNPYVPILEKQTTGTWTWYVSKKESTGSHLSMFVCEDVQPVSLI